MIEGWEVDIDTPAGFIVFTDGHIEPAPEMPLIKNKLFLIVEKGSKSPLDKFGPVHEIDVYH